MILRRWILLLLLVVGSGGIAAAVEPDERLADPVLEARARAISQELRCLVCQNTSIDESNASLAKDLRILVRERVTAGDTDQQVLDFMVARYGDFVLLKPRLTPVTWLLWFGPPGLLVGAVLALVWRARGRRAVPAPTPLSPEERAAVVRLMGRKG